MTRIIASLNLFVWSGIWALGYLALNADGPGQPQIVIAAVLIFAGIVAGIPACFRPERAAEISGSARKPSQLHTETRSRAHARGAI